MRTKSFDCVQMKQDVQARLLEREQQSGPEKFQDDRQRWLVEGQDDLAVFWRRVKGANTMSPPTQSRAVP
jgi:hypothetical protein